MPVSSTIQRRKCKGPGLKWSFDTSQIGTHRCFPVHSVLLSKGRCLSTLFMTWLFSFTPPIFLDYQLVHSDSLVLGHTGCLHCWSRTCFKIAAMLAIFCTGYTLDQRPPRWLGLRTLAALPASLGGASNTFTATSSLIRCWYFRLVQSFPPPVFCVQCQYSVCECCYPCQFPDLMVVNLSIRYLIFSHKILVSCFVWNTAQSTTTGC